MHVNYVKCVVRQNWILNSFLTNNHSFIGTGGFMTLPDIVILVALCYVVELCCVMLCYVVS